uniref:Small ribosomal subunit protein uS9c n=1 Tax=Ishige okamurae TaxID=233772 RepID=A0A8E5XRM8_9PHAE|nr:ribosomal protein S9 [Ishige okamurae]QVJ99681.1 ribosomal protein S9 [Ishige okamurae]
MTILEQISPHIYGIGRRKEATAIVYLIPITESNSKILFEVNGRLGEQYFQQNFFYLNQIYLPFKVITSNIKYKICVTVKGGGLTGQAESIKLGIARALCKIDRINFRPTLKLQGLLKRDARIKERRKYGLKKARKASQYSKR